jgi:hypothetical protein
MFLVNEFIFI